MNVFELLKTDHEKVSRIFDELAETTERAVKTREEKFAQLKQELDIHAHIEETIFYPILKREAETRAITLEGFQEHRVIKRLLTELEEMSVESEVWTAKFKVLKESVEHHVDEEEDEMFTQARAVLSKEQLEEIGTVMEAEKKKQKQQLGASA